MRERVQEVGCSGKEDECGLHDLTAQVRNWRVRSFISLEVFGGRVGVWELFLLESLVSLSQKGKKSVQSYLLLREKNLNGS